MQFIDEAGQLGFEVIHLSFALGNLLLFLLQVVLFLVNLSIEVLSAVQGL